jgi:hypothetical protein
MDYAVAIQRAISPAVCAAFKRQASCAGHAASAQGLSMFVNRESAVLIAKLCIQ